MDITCLFVTALVLRQSLWVAVCTELAGRGSHQKTPVLLPPLDSPTLPWAGAVGMGGRERRWGEGME